MKQKYCACGDCDSEDIIPEEGMAVMCDKCAEYACEEGQLSCNYRDSDQAVFDRQLLDDERRDLDCVQTTDG